MPSTQSQFSILEASIISTSTYDDESVVDVKSNVLELQFFEHIGKPFIDAKIVLIDDMGLKDAIGIQGTEKFRIVIGDPSGLEEPSIVKYFYISNITQTKKLNDRSEMLAIDLVEEQVFVDAIKQFSRSYTSTLEDMITSICERDLGKIVDKEDFDGSVQGVRKVIIPFMSPLSAIQWLKNRATSKIGAPIYLYSSLYQDELKMANLDKLLQADVINDKLPLRFSKAVQGTDDPLRPYFEVLELNEIGGDNALELYEDGAIGSFYSNLDAGTGNSVDNHITIRDIIDEFYTNDLISADTIQSIYDDALLIGGKLSDTYNSLHIHQVTSIGTYNQFLSYHDESTLLDDKNNIIESRLKVKNKIIRAIMKKNMIDIGIDGSMLIRGKVSVGNKLRVLFLKSDVNGDEKDLSEQVDMSKSGDYFIVAINNKMSSESHVAQLRLTKLGDLPDNFTL